MEAIANLSGYEITEQVYIGTYTLVYRGIRTGDQQPVVIKLLRNKYPNFSELLQFRNQYTIAKNLDFPSIIKPLSLEVYYNSYALVMEDFGGVSLSTYLQTATDRNQLLNSLSLTEFLHISLQVTDILEYLYQKRVIHKDIKPANILINPETKQVKLIDFSIASLLPRETQEILNPNVLEGTLAYISPEQTGRMNRGIDYRSDFYSLGVTFYQLLTGKLPFVSEDPMELIHFHLAKQPLFVHTIAPDIPLILSQIVGKLMAKNAEDRYQSALGLKHDLETCLAQLQATGTIQNFLLRKRDLTDRFIIPEKLYGRSKEVKALLKSFDRVATPLSSPLAKGGQRGVEMMLISGFSGIGKTAVINEVHKPIARQRSYFVKGKYDQFQRNIPFSAFVQAFRDLMGQLLAESDAQLQTWKTSILSALGDNGQVLIDVIPELERVIGPQPPAAELSGTAAQNRFKLLVQKFIKVFPSPEHPLVMFIDDLQWADSGSLNLLKLLMQDTEYLLVLGAYRDNEVSPAHPFILTVDEIRKTGVAIDTITLQPLSLEHMNQLVADTLNCDRPLAQPLTELVYQKTKGNPFFATQFLKALHDDKLISFDWEIRHWQCDLARVKVSALTDDVVEFMALQLQKLPTETQEVLKLAACIGAQFDLNTLAIVSEQSESDAAALLWKVLQEGLILPISQSYKFFQANDSESRNRSGEITVAYKFLHDRVQQAAYSLIPNSQKQATHYQIGQLLLQRISPSGREERIFELVNQLNYGTDLITQQTEREELAFLNLTAGRKARSATAYQAAREYTAVALSMLGETAWETQYQMTLSLHELAAEVSWFCGDFERMEQWIEAVLQTARTPLEQVKVYQIKIDALTSQNNFLEAIATGKIVLNRLGVNLPDSPTPDDAKQAMQEIVVALGDRPIEELFELPKMVDAQQMAIQKIAATLITPCYGAHSPYLFLMPALQVQRSIQFGNSPNSAFGYAVYGALLSMLFRNIGLADQFGRLAHHLILESDAKSDRTSVLCAIGILRHRICHVRETLPLFQEGYQVGVETGSLDFAGQNGSMFVWYTFWSGQNLMEVEPLIEAYQQQLLDFNQITQSDYCLICWESVLMLMGRSEYREIAAQQEELLSQKLASNDLLWVYKWNLHRCSVNFLLGNIPEAEQQAAQARSYLKVGAGNIGEIIFYFYDSLIALATVAVEYDEVAAQQQRVQNNQIQLEFFAGHAPMNYQHKWQLVEADRCRVFGSKAEAIDLYDRAIKGAKKNQYFQDEALANELAAKFYLEWGKERIAAGYMQEAYYCYARWGAKAKIDDLETRYPQLLQSILLEANQPSSVLETLTSTLNSSCSIHSNIYNGNSTKSLNHTLDFAALLKVSQTLSSTIELDELLRTLIQTMLENSGADKCALILSQEDQWQVRVMADLEQITLQTVPLENHAYLPVKLIQYVKNTLTSILMDDLDIDLPVIGNYLYQYHPKSVLCLPILDRGNLVGILYLENRSMAGAFTGDRILVINFLCTQAAISLENARLYALEQQKSREIAQKEAEYRSIFESVNDGLSICDLATGKIITANPTICQIYGYSPEEWLDLTPMDFMHPDYLHLFSNYLETLNSGQEFYAQGISKRKDGSFFDFEVKAVPFIYKGKLHGLTILRDISQQQAALRDRQAAENIVVQKSQSLEQTLVELQNTQLQLVQSEKMSALGNLVAGVAHEINNPIGCIVGNVGAIQDYINDLLGIIDLYQEELPQPSEKIENELEAIDLDYVREDLPKLIRAMKDGGDRIISISKSLRTFSRTDSDAKQKFNLHDGIDSTVLILRHRLKANENRPSIEVVTDYGRIPEIPCFPGQINQVFMNILANAIDALDESNTDRKFGEIEVNPNQITIQTRVENDLVKIAMVDNGRGMPETVKNRIFDHLFTTKGVGKGTGLGMAIARQIVVEKHGGAIEVDSQVGQGTTFTILLPIAA